MLASNAVLIPGKPVEQRIQGNGGWAEGDASYAGDNPASGAPITYYQKARHVIGRMKLEILDANGNVVDEVPASKRRGLNRVNWPMRTKPPQVPPAASLAGSSAFGERFLPGTYTVRLTKAGQVSTAPLVADSRQARDLYRRRPSGAVRRCRTGQRHVCADEQARR